MNQTKFNDKKDHTKSDFQTITHHSITTGIGWAKGLIKRLLFIVNWVTSRRILEFFHPKVV
jgi:hypothetical protein